MDKRFMQRALDLAKKGRGRTNPNPMVGAVIVKEGKVIGEGYHESYGGPHAEIRAIGQAGSDSVGATMYVTLEPCSHYGKTPPCVDALIEHRLKRVVIAMQDPNPKVAGKGIQKLIDAGMQVDTGVMEEEAKQLNEIFIKYIQTQRPFVMIKTAMTMDGKTATYSGESRWITNSYSRAYVHEQRHQYAAIMVGIQTVVMDNPALTTRLANGEGRNPIRVIVDSMARLPLESQIVQTAHQVPTLLAITPLASIERVEKLRKKGVQILLCKTRQERVDLRDLMEKIGVMEIDSILVEGGATLNASLLEQHLVDKMMTFIAPKIFGGQDAPTSVMGKGIASPDDAIGLTKMQVKMFGQDVVLESYVKGD